MARFPDFLRLVRGLRARTSFTLQCDLAGEMVALGTREALDFLTCEIANGGRAADACMSALRANPELSASHVLRALANSPDCERLVMCLPDEVGQEAASILSRVCGRTTNHWVIRHAIPRIARKSVSLARELAASLARRDNERMSAALEIGLVEVAGTGSSGGLVRYLQPGADRDVWAMALSVGGVLDLPEGQDCLRRNLHSGNWEDRANALGIVEFSAATEFAGEALKAWMEDAKPQVRWAGLQALQAIDALPDDVLAGVLAREAECVRASALACAGAWRQGRVTEAHWQAAQDALDRLGRAMVAAWLVSPDPLEHTTSVIPVFSQSASLLSPLTLDDNAVRDAAPLLARITHSWLFCARYLYRQGHAPARLTAMQLAGRCVDIPGGAEPVAARPPEEMALGTIVAQMRRLCAKLSLSQLRDCQPGWTNDAETHFPAPPTFALGQALAVRVAWARSLPRENLAREVIGELRSSQQREHHARRAAARTLGEAAIDGAQTAWADYPPITLSYEASVVHGFFPAVLQEGGDLSPLVPLFAEQNLQTALLAVLAGVLSDSAVPVLIKCLRSTNALVTELAERLLFRIGRGALPRLQEALSSTANAAVQARLLEVARCIDSPSVLDAARALLSNEDSLLAAASAKVCGDAGSPADVASLRARASGGDELVTACAVEATGRLDASGNRAWLTGATASPYPAVRGAALHALAGLDPSERDRIAQQLRDADNALQRLAAAELTEPDALQRILVPSFCGRGYPAVGNYALGAQMATAGPQPWQWGIGALMRDTHRPWSRWTALIGSGDELAELWLEYAVHGELPVELPWMLRGIAVSDDGRATDAAELLGALFADNLCVALDACLRYHGAGPGEAVDDAARRASDTALRRCTLRVVGGVSGPNVTASNPLGEAALTQSDGDHLGTMFPVAFGYLFAAELPRALGLPGLHLPDEVDARRAAVETEWERLMQFEDATFGFLVAPRLVPEDLVGYCQCPDADEHIRREMINYLVMLATVLPTPSDVQGAAVDALQRLYAPLLAKTTTELVRLRWDLNRDECESAVDTGFHSALGAYDPFWAQHPSAFGPFGRLSQTVDGMPEHDAAVGGFAPHPSSFIPFTHYLEQRLAHLLLEHRELQRRDEDTLSLTSAEVERDLDATYAKQELTRLSAETAECDEDQPDLATDETVSPMTSAVRLTHMVPVNGVLTECYHLETLADLLGTTPGALQARERRGQFRLHRHDGEPYWPVEQVRALAAMLVTDTQLAERLGVDRRSIGRWRDEAPAGLSPMEMMEHLAGRAESAPRTGKRVRRE